MFLNILIYIRPITELDIFWNNSPSYIERRAYIYKAIYKENLKHAWTFYGHICQYVFSTLIYDLQFCRFC